VTDGQTDLIRQADKRIRDFFEYALYKFTLYFTLLYRRTDRIAMAKMCYSSSCCHR